MITILLPTTSAKYLTVGQGISATEYGDPPTIVSLLSPELLLEDGGFILLESDETILLG